MSRLHVFGRGGTLGRGSSVGRETDREPGGAQEFPALGEGRARRALASSGFPGPGCERRAELSGRQFAAAFQDALRQAGISRVRAGVCARGEHGAVVPLPRGSSVRRLHGREAHQPWFPVLLVAPFTGMVPDLDGMLPPGAERGAAGQLRAGPGMRRAEHVAHGSPLSDAARPGAAAAALAAVHGDHRTSRPVAHRSGRRDRREAYELVR